MGKLKKAAEAKSYYLTKREFDYLSLLNYTCGLSVLKDKVIAGFLIYICTTRFGYSEDVNLQFEIDLNSDSHELKVKEVSTEVAAKK